MRAFNLPLIGSDHALSFAGGGMMTGDRRKHERRNIDFACWLSDANTPQPIEARVANISEGGAKVVCQQKADFQDHIELYFTRSATVGRRCNVIWRADNAIGLMFVEKILTRDESLVVI